MKVTDISHASHEFATQEIDMLKRLVHPHIICPYNVFEANNFLYVILEYCENGTLGDAIKTGGLKLRQALTYFQDITSAVAACHRKGIAHRDIKASNMLLDSHGMTLVYAFVRIVTHACGRSDVQ